MKTDETVRKAVFPAAGLGTRFLPATKASPKEMLPLVDKPLIQYGVEEALSSGIEEIVVITGRGKRAIEDHFDVSFELEHELRQKRKFKLLAEVERISGMVDFSYIRQRNALGLGHAILCAERAVNGEPFAVILSDDIIDSKVPATRQMMKVFKKYKDPVIAICEVDEAAVSSYGIIDGVEVEDGIYQIRDLVEKPAPGAAPSNLAIIGRYILTPDIFDALRRTKPGKGGEIQLTDGLRDLMASRPLYAFKFKGTRYDAGDKLGFLKATVEYALRDKELGPAFREYLRGLKK
ncbi:MAG: UTP--glucose-1-phosphate uridylyltransferase GalU [Nitrospirae bacterium]|nr:UTP--glucose-1-phosphate uridylyltransferase GalU [Nitrospirota bacterium]